MPFDRARYPDDWEAISLRIRARSGGRCEGPAGRAREDDPDLEAGDPDRCGARHGELHPTTRSRVVLTVAHVTDPDPMNCSDSNLAALCQRCHLNHDRPHHVAKARRRRHERRAAGDLFSGLYSASA